MKQTIEILFKEARQGASGRYVVYKTTDGTMTCFKDNVINELQRYGFNSPIEIEVDIKEKNGQTFKNIVQIHSNPAQTEIVQINDNPPPTPKPNNFNRDVRLQNAAKALAVLFAKDSVLTAKDFAKACKEFVKELYKEVEQ